MQSHPEEEPSADACRDEHHGQREEEPCAPPAPSPDRRVGRDGRVGRVDGVVGDRGPLEALESSHPQLVQPLVLRDLGALSYAEIADELDVPLGTVKARIHQARKAVAERLTVR